MPETKPAPLTYATPATEPSSFDRQAGIFATGAVAFLVAALVLGAVGSAMRDSETISFAVSAAGLVTMVVSVASALAAFGSAVLALGRPGRRVNAIWALIVSSLILLAAGAIIAASLGSW